MKKLNRRIQWEGSTEKKYFFVSTAFAPKTWGVELRIVATFGLGWYVEFATRLGPFSFLAFSHAAVSDEDGLFLIDE